jgi:hypothetical protein
MLAFCAGYSSATVSSADNDSAPTVEIDTHTSHIDVYGNEIDDAVGDYRIDPHGDLYESHAPDTALLKLNSPSS